MEAVGNDEGRYWAFSGCRPDCSRGEREREKRGRDGWLPSPLFLSRQSACDSETHSEAGAGPAGHAELGMMQLLLSRTLQLCHGNKISPRKESDKGLHCWMQNVLSNTESGKGGDSEGRMMENRFLRCQATDRH